MDNTENNKILIDMSDYVSKEKIKRKLQWVKDNTCIYCGGECVELQVYDECAEKYKNVYFEAAGIEIILEQLLKGE